MYSNSAERSLYSLLIWPCAPHWNTKDILESKPLVTPTKSLTLQHNSKEPQGPLKNQISILLQRTLEEDKKKCNPMNVDDEEKKKPSSSSTSKKKRKKMNRMKRMKGEASQGDDEKEKKERTVSPLESLPQENHLHILSYLNRKDLKRVGAVCKLFQTLALSKSLLVAPELICFHSKTTFNEDTLGIGLKMEFRENDGVLMNITSPLDLISKHAFYYEGVRKSIWGQPMSKWLPIYINKHHGNLSALQMAIQDIYQSHPNISPKTPNLFQWRALDMMSKLMNSIIVEIMKGNVHASIKALQGYCYFHRWMLFLVQQYPECLSELENQVQNFVKFDQYRHKYACPNLGEFLTKLSVLGPSGLTWNYIRDAVVQEAATRNVLWVLKQFPHLSNFEGISDSERIEKTWQANQVSCKLIMFHVFFLKNVVEKHGQRSLEEIGRLYDMNYGCCLEDNLEELLQKELFKIQEVATLREYCE
ncbi:hypothetical protein FDP41_009268 [Naegleria fowleri]|uniref:F-box domain-containing protein n=1 Tax=Naegleria fowleri TaxID=5763 RepID=A0A6A5BE57_NAEFO|nr:uncharacterized protein FDP41_009268 [Naegleria fowleri]KAF0972365.1 hypothetical protein FDP41_009268 [Naegleria fowleri]